jgi:hypothetical protein
VNTYPTTSFRMRPRHLLGSAVRVLCVSSLHCSPCVVLTHTSAYNTVLQVHRLGVLATHTYSTDSTARDPHAAQLHTSSWVRRAVEVVINHTLVLLLLLRLA